MALFPKKSEEEKALASARADLTAAQKRRAILASSESAASVSADKWEMWCAERDAANNEVDRSTKRVAAIEAAISEAARAAAEAETLRQAETCRAAVETLGSRFKGDGAAAISTLMALARDDAKLAIEAQRLNAILPAGVKPIPIASLQARDLPPVPRDEIASEIQDLWVNIQGVPVGDQDAVVEGDDGKGVLEVNRSTKIICTKRKFRSTTFRPAFLPNSAGYFFSGLRLPYPNQPGFAFDGSTMVLQHVAAIDVELPPPPKPFYFPARTELVPVEPWPPAGGATEAARAAVA